jgi:hypothetical protein
MAMARLRCPQQMKAQSQSVSGEGRLYQEAAMSTVPVEPYPELPMPVPPQPEIPPVEEPEPDRMPDEAPTPNPDENDRPPKVL